MTAIATTDGPVHIAEACDDVDTDIELEMEECEESYDLREDVLTMIAGSSSQDFDGNGIQWGNWCREIAVAALNDDVEAVIRRFVVGLEA